jgi:hypothetical protein
MHEIQRAQYIVALVPNDEGRLLELVRQRLDEIELLPELRQALMQLAEGDAARLVAGRHWSWLIPSLRRLLGEPEADITPFFLAWSTLHLATSRLDHLQDNDPPDQLGATGSPSIQYNLALTTYALATGLLDLLVPVGVPPHRILRLYRLWSTRLLCTAGGQHSDLALMNAAAEDDLLEVYQQVAQAKSGAMFALAFGGTATLLTDDILDGAEQPSNAATLPVALGAHARSDREQAAARNLPAFWHHLYPAYLAYLDELTARSTQVERDGLRALFAFAFEQPLPSESTCER